MESLNRYIPYAHMIATLFGLIELGLTCYRKFTFIHPTSPHQDTPLTFFPSSRITLVRPRHLRLPAILLRLDSPGAHLHRLIPALLSQVVPAHHRARAGVDHHDLLVCGVDRPGCSSWVSELRRQYLLRIDRGC